MVVIGAFLAFVATRPSQYRVERSVVTKAKAEAVFPLVSDLRRFPEWSPWEKLDPGMKKTFGGSGPGKGQSYEWSSPKDEVGSGRMTVTESKPNERVDIKLEFIAPWQGLAQTALILKPEGQGTKVT